MRHSSDLRAVAECRSFTLASVLVHLTQPGVSKHIKQMEEYFGAPLFDRVGKRVTPTESGRILYEATQEIMATIEAAERRIDDLKGLCGGELRLGTSFPVGVYLLPGVLAEFRERYPGAEVTLDISVSEAIETRLLGNDLDLGLVSHVPRNPRLQAKVFMTDELVVIVPGKHEWAAKQHIKPQDLVAKAFIVAAPGAGTRTVVEERLKALDIALPHVLEFGNLEGVKHAVEAGLGVSIQAKSVVQREVATGSLRAIRLRGMDAKIDFFYAFRKGAHVTNAAQALVGLLHEQFPARR